MILSKILGEESIEEKVDRKMQSKNLKVEVRGDNGWEPFED